MASNNSVVNCLKFHNPELYSQIVRDLAVAETQAADSKVFHLREQLQAAELKAADLRKKATDLCAEHKRAYPHSACEPSTVPFETTFPEVLTDGDRKSNFGCY